MNKKLFVNKHTSVGLLFQSQHYKIDKRETEDK